MCLDNYKMLQNYIIQLNTDSKNGEVKIYHKDFYSSPKNVIKTEDVTELQIKEVNVPEISRFEGKLRKTLEIIC